MFEFSLAKRPGASFPTRLKIPLKSAVRAIAANPECGEPHQWELDFIRLSISASGLPALTLSADPTYPSSHRVVLNQGFRYSRSTHDENTGRYSPTTLRW